MFPFNFAPTSQFHKTTGFLVFTCRCYVYLDREDAAAPWTINRVFMPSLCSEEHRAAWREGRDGELPKL